MQGNLMSVIAVERFLEALRTLPEEAGDTFALKAADFCERFVCLREVREARAEPEPRKGGPAHFGYARRRADRGERGGERDRGGDRDRERTGEAPRERPRIGARELSTEALARKEFLSLLNKITDTNVDAMLVALKTRLRDTPECRVVYRALLWEFCLRMPKMIPVYMRVLRVLPAEPEAWEMQYAAYVQADAWIPPPEVLEDAPAEEAEAPSAASAAAAYDDFCAYVKWKKQALAAVVAWITLMREGIIQQDPACLQETLVALIDQQLCGVIRKEVLDPLLEQLLTSVSLLGVGGGLRRRLRAWVGLAPSLEPSSRFKIYDLRDALKAPVKK